MERSYLIGLTLVTLFLIGCSQTNSDGIKPVSTKINQNSPIEGQCLDGDTYNSYYSKIDYPEGFQSSHNPSNEILNARIAYFEDHACRNTDSEGYYIKKDSNFKKVSAEEYNSFIATYNKTCNGCLVEHYDGCC